MGKWDAAREQLKKKKDEAQTSQERAVQKEKIVSNLQDDLWNSLKTELFAAVESINTDGTLLEFSDIPKSRSIKITASRVDRTLTASVIFDAKSHRITISFAESPRETRITDLRYEIAVNSDNKAELVDQNTGAIAPGGVVDEVISKLVG